MCIRDRGGGVAVQGHGVGVVQQVAAGRREPVSYTHLVFAALAAATLAGALTQYFFLVFCFFFCGLFGLWLLATRRWKEMCIRDRCGFRPHNRSPRRRPAAGRGSGRCCG